jgi:hypothetical protein
MKEFLQKIYNFLVVNDFPTLLESIRQIKWADFIKNPLAWLIILPITVALVWTKRFKIIAAIASFAAFLLLLQNTLPPMGDKIPLNDLVIFCGGAFGLVFFNLYIFIIKE